MGRANKRQTEDQINLTEIREIMKQMQEEIRILKEGPRETRIKMLSEEIDVLHEGITATQQTLTQIKNHLAKSNTTTVQRKPELRIPTFDPDKRDRPKRYIKEIKKYIELSGIEHDLYTLVNEGLKNGANDWLYAVQESINSFKTFETKFLKRYWSEETQKKLKTQIAFGHFSREGRLTRVEYAIRMSNHARDLDMAEEDAVVAIREHFDIETANSIWGWKIKTLDDLIEFLERVDNRKTFKNEQTPQNESGTLRPKPWQIQREDKKIQSVKIEESSSSTEN